MSNGSYIDFGMVAWK